MNGLAKLIGKWWDDPNWWAQGAHFLFGVVFVTVPFFFWPRYGLTPPLIGTVALFTYGIVKEVYLDPWLEGDPLLWDGLIDMGFLFFGGATIWAIKFLIGG